MKALTFLKSSLFIVLAIYILCLSLIVISFSGCAHKVEYITQKCNLPEHKKPKIVKMESNEDVINYLKEVLKSYDLLLIDYEVCR